MDRAKQLPKDRVLIVYAVGSTFWGIWFMEERCRPGEIRDAIVGFLADRQTPASVAEIRAAVANKFKAMAPSSVRSYLRLNDGKIFERTGARELSGWLSGQRGSIRMQRMYPRRLRCRK